MISVLALDLEGTLISNAMSQIPRPGLFDFLKECNKLVDRVVVYTTVKEEKFRPIAKLLVEEGYAPIWFSDIEYVNWSGEVKDLSFIPGAQVKDSFLVDDYHMYIAPGQESQWIEIQQFDYPYPDDDVGFLPVLEAIRNDV